MMNSANEFFIQKTRKPQLLLHDNKIQTKMMIKFIEKRSKHLGNLLLSPFFVFSFLCSLRERLEKYQI